MIERVRHCPVCATIDRTLLTTKDRYGEPYQAWLCDGCALIYADPIRSEEEADEWYATEYRKQYGYEVRSHPLLCPFARTIADFLRHFSIRPARVLEYGCGTGDWLVELRTAFDCEIFGHDADPMVMRAAREQGVQRDDGGFYDLIIFNHSLEHLSSPVGVIAVARSTQLDVGGRIFVAVPGLYTWSIDRLWQSAHTVQFTRATLEHLMWTCGMAPIYADEAITSLWRRQDEPFDTAAAERWRIVRSLATRAEKA